MASTIFCNYLVRLHHDADELYRYKQNPDSRAQMAGLTSEQAAALKSKDSARIHAALCVEAGVAPGGTVPMNNIHLQVLVGEL
jgi:hypothetical protein